MADKELVEGLRTALSKGESLEQAMYTFFNAGYKKAKIEEAARALVYQRQPESMPQKPVFPKPKPRFKPRKILKPSPRPLLPPKTKAQLKPQLSLPVSKLMPPPETFPAKPSPEPYIPPTSPREKTKSSKQIVSGYEKKPHKKKLAVILLIIFLIVLIGALASVFIFRQELIEIFNNLIESF